MGERAINPVALQSNGATRSPAAVAVGSGAAVRQESHQPHSALQQLAPPVPAGLPGRVPSGDEDVQAALRPSSEGFLAAAGGAAGPVAAAAQLGPSQHQRVRDHVMEHDRRQSRLHAVFFLNYRNTWNAEQADAPCRGAPPGHVGALVQRGASGSAVPVAEAPLDTVVDYHSMQRFHAFWQRMHALGVPVPRQSLWAFTDPNSLTNTQVGQLRLWAQCYG